MGSVQAQSAEKKPSMSASLASYKPAETTNGYGTGSYGTGSHGANGSAGQGPDKPANGGCALLDHFLLLSWAL